MLSSAQSTMARSTVLAIATSSMLATTSICRASFHFVSKKPMYGVPGVKAGEVEMKPSGMTSVDPKNSPESVLVVNPSRTTLPTFSPGPLITTAPNPLTLAPVGAGSASPSRRITTPFRTSAPSMSVFALFVSTWTIHVPLEFTARLSIDVTLPTPVTRSPSLRRTLGA